MKRAVALPLMVLATSIIGCASSQTQTNSAAGTLMVTRTSKAGLTLHEDMRRLWAEHVVWTRLYIIAYLANDGSDTVALDRLMQNQIDIGTAIKPFYGDEAGTKLSQLLQKHIAIAGDLLTAAKNGDDAKKTEADRQWHQNAEEIATFLAGANKHLTKDMVYQMLDRHLALTLREAVYRMQREWKDDQVNYDAIFGQAMEMADGLSEGILKQFPNRA